MKILNAIICDQVRVEDNGKHLLVGVYPINAMMPKFPTTAMFALWMQVQVDRNGEFDVEFRIRKDKQTRSMLGAAMNVTDHLSPVTIALPPAPVEIDGECTLFFQIREKDQRWKTVKELPVLKQPSAVEPREGL